VSVAEFYRSLIYPRNLLTCLCTASHNTLEFCDVKEVFTVFNIEASVLSVHEVLLSTVKCVFT